MDNKGIIYSKQYVLDRMYQSRHTNTSIYDNVIAILCITKRLEEIGDVESPERVGLESTIEFLFKEPVIPCDHHCCCCC